MLIDRVSVKLNAKEIIRTSKPSLLMAALLYTLLGILISWLSLRLTGVDTETLSKMMELSATGETDAVMLLMSQSMPSTEASLLDILLRVAYSVVGAGFVLFTLNCVRKTEPALGNLLDGFGMMPRLLFLIILRYLMIILWSMLLIVPGIVAAYRYSLAIYIMIDHPEYGAIDCLRESKRMTRGYKMQLFLLDLSFLGWGILSMFPVVGYAAQVWATPYLETAKALYYEQIRDKGFVAG